MRTGIPRVCNLLVMSLRGRNQGRVRSVRRAYSARKPCLEGRAGPVTRSLWSVKSRTRASPTCRPASFCRRRGPPPAPHPACSFPHGLRPGPLSWELAERRRAKRCGSRRGRWAGTRLDRPPRRSHRPGHPRRSGQGQTTGPERHRTLPDLGPKRHLQNTLLYKSAFTYTCDV